MGKCILRSFTSSKTSAVAVMSVFPRPEPPSKRPYVQVPRFQAVDFPSSNDRSPTCNAVQKDNNAVSHIAPGAILRSKLIACPFDRGAASCPADRLCMGVAGSHTGRPPVILQQ